MRYLQTFPLYFLTACCLLSSFSARERGDYSSIPIPKFTINLDLPLRDQYKDILPQFSSTVKELISLLKVVPKVRLVHLFGRLLLAFQPDELREEVKVMSELLNISVSDLAINIVNYELFAGCTSLVAVNEKNELIFGRNLDYPTAMYLYKLSYQVSAYKGGKHLYDAVQLAGFYGYHVAFNSRHKVAISLNQRENPSILRNMFRFLRGYLNPLTIIKRAIDKGLNYNQTIQYLNSTEITANCYFTIGSMEENKGSVITKDVISSQTKYDSLDLENGRWFLVQTNYDRDVPDPVDDYRRTPAEEKLRKNGRNLTDQQVFDLVLSQYPNNNNITASTTIVSKSGFNTTLWTGGYDDPLDIISRN